MAHRGMKLKVTGQGKDAISLTSVLDRGQFSSINLCLPGLSQTKGCKTVVVVVVVVVVENNILLLNAPLCTFVQTSVSLSV